MPYLSIVILTYNSSKYITQCLASIFNKNQKRFADENFELIIFDNASSDNTLNSVFAYLKTKFNIIKDLGSEKIINITKNVKIVKNQKNLGFAGGINSAVEYSSGKYLLLLNPDAYLLKGDLDMMVDILDNNPDIGIAGGKVLNDNDKEELSAGNFFTLYNIFLMTLGLDSLLHSRVSPKEKKLVDFVSGGFMFVRRDLFNSLKGFDANYFMYVEDMDFCYRAKLAGFKTIFLPQCSVIHSIHGSSNKSFAIVNIVKGVLYFNSKYGIVYTKYLVKLMFAVKALSVMLIAIISFNKKLFLTYYKVFKKIL